MKKVSLYYQFRFIERVQSEFEKVVISWRQFEGVIRIISGDLYRRNVGWSYSSGIRRTLWCSNGLVCTIIFRNQYRFTQKLNTGKMYNMINGFPPDPDAHVAIWYGEKEPNMKKAIKKLKRTLPNAEDHPFKGFGHGESSNERIIQHIKTNH